MFSFQPSFLINMFLVLHAQIACSVICDYGRYEGAQVLDATAVKAELDL